MGGTSDLGPGRNQPVKSVITCPGLEITDCFIIYTQIY